MDIDKFMSTWFVDAVRACLKEGGFAQQDRGQEQGGSFLVGYAGRLYEIQSDYQVARGVQPYAAVGSGADLALGALHALHSGPLDMAPDAMLTHALAAAEQFSAGVRGPYVVVHSAGGETT